MGKRILLVEDDDDFRSVIVMVLRSAGYEIEAAVNGADGLAAYARFRPDLVLLDVHLPDMSGVDVLRRIRSGGPAPKTPVLLCTVRSAFGPVAEGLSAGADDYIVKPFSIEDLVARVGAFLKEKGA
jgi:two-component system OmpR family response regulator